jgi:hypothetical protein
MSVISADSVSTNRGTPVGPAPSLLRGLLKFVGSIWLSVIILFVLVVIMLWGTIVANKYGDTAAKFGIYGAWWFNALGLLLGVNSAASLVLRWPWKRQQLGFTLPHLGLIVLLVGCYISRYYGVEAVVTVIEGHSSNRAYQNYSQKFELSGGQRFKLQVESSDTAKRKTWIDVPFTSGPFNWQDYSNGSLSTLPWAVEHSDQWVSRVLLGIERLTWGQIWSQGRRDHPGILYEGDRIRLEVLDYLSNSAPSDQPGVDPSPRQFDKDFADGGPRLRQAKVRLTVDGHSDEFWIPCVTFDPQEMVGSHGFSGEEVRSALKESVFPERFRHVVQGVGRQITLTFEPQSFELGFDVQLDKAWQKLDPGAPYEARKSEFASEIDLVPNLSEAEVSASGAAAPPKYEGLRVTLNAPLDFTDPRSKKSFRMFQSTMSPKAFDPQEFGIKLGEPVYVSGLSLNDDPGRGVTYVGCLMIVAGIFVAYFVRIPPPRRS